MIFSDLGFNMEGKLVNTHFQMGLGGSVGPSASPSGRLASCWGLLRAPRGARWGLKGAHIKSFENSGRHLEPAKAPKEPPRSPQEHPKRAQESPKTLIKSIFRSQTLIFPKSSSRQSEIKVFEGRRVSLRAQNRVLTMVVRTKLSSNRHG